MITTSIIFQEVQYILIELRGLIKNRQISETEILCIQRSQIQTIF